MFLFPIVFLSFTERPVIFMQLVDDLFVLVAIHRSPNPQLGNTSSRECV